MRAEIDELAFGLTLERYKDQSESGQGTGDASAMLKYVGTELNKARQELIMAGAGSDALEWDDGRARSGCAARRIRSRAARRR